MNMSSPLIVGLVHDTLRVPSCVVGTTDTLSGTGATVVEKVVCLISVYYQLDQNQCCSPEDVVQRTQGTL